MNRSLLLILLIAVAVGAIGGTIIAVAVPRSSAPSVARAAVPPAVPLPPKQVRRTARATPERSFSLRLRALTPRRATLRTPDPRGGPDWILRTELVERRSPPDPGKRESRAVGRSRCVQAGRLHAGSFGWLDPVGTFRPVPLRFNGAPVVCGSRRADMGGDPQVVVATTTSDLRRPAAVAVQTLVFGLIGTAGRDARLTVAGRRTSLPTGAGGTVFALLPGAVKTADIRLSVRYAGRGRVRALGGPGRRLPLRQGIRRFPMPTGVPVLTAQAPDPDGGLPYALEARPSTTGGRCSSSGGRVVGDRAGSLDVALGVFTEGGGGGGCSNPPRRGEKQFAVSWGTSFAGGLGAIEGEAPGPGRVARRLPRGRLVLSGLAQPGVVAVTIQSPSDVRTLTPTGPGRGIIAVYQDFPTGTIQTTARFRDGHTERQTVPLGNF